jgi:valyl-tRNA synthetase
LLLTGFDIIFFWVARMMMLGIYCIDDRPARDRVPFREVYITPLVRDQYGKKMTKSRGNVVDPLEIMEKYGTDAVRFTLAQLAVQGRDLILSDDRLAAARAFANKIWNAARFVIMNLADAPQPLKPVDSADLGLAERWILSRLDSAVREVTAAIDAYEFNRAAMIVYQFIWHEFCDWYIELAKDPLKAGGESQAAARYVLVECFDRMLRILHPFMPFISEEIWQALRPYFPATDLSEHLAVAKFPTPSAARWLTDAEATAMDQCIAATQAVNSLRTLVGHHPGQEIDVTFRPRLADASSAADMEYQLQRNVWDFLPYFKALANVHSVSFAHLGEENGGRMVTTLIDWCEISVKTPEAFDFAKARELTAKKLAEVKKHLEQHTARLANKDFLAKADIDTREATRIRADQLKDEEIRLGVQLRDLASVE